MKETVNLIPWVGWSASLRSYRSLLVPSSSLPRRCFVSRVPLFTQPLREEGVRWGNVKRPNRTSDERRGRKGKEREDNMSIFNRFLWSNKSYIRYQLYIWLRKYNISSYIGIISLCYQDYRIYTLVPYVPLNIDLLSLP